MEIYYEYQNFVWILYENIFKARIDLDHFYNYGHKCKRVIESSDTMLRKTYRIILNHFKVDYSYLIIQLYL